MSEGRLVSRHYLVCVVDTDGTFWLHDTGNGQYYYGRECRSWALRDNKAGAYRFSKRSDAMRSAKRTSCISARLCRRNGHWKVIEVAVYHSEKVIRTNANDVVTVIGALDDQS